MKRPFPFVLAAFLLFLAVPSASGLTVGDPAPPIAVGKWVKQGPVTTFEKGKIYVVTFWASWSDPSKAAVPRLTELAKKYKDIPFLGVSAFERDDAAVDPFIKESGDAIQYPVAMDDKSVDKTGAMATQWMRAAKQSNIPASFVVGKEGTILWIGHPSGLAPVLDKILAGTYDLAAAKAQVQKEQKRQEILESIRTDVARLVQTAQEKKDFAAAIKSVDDILAKYPEVATELLQVRLTLAGEGRQWDVFYETCDKLVEIDVSHANNIAWMIATSPALEKRDFERALKFALKAVETSNGTDGNILDTLARVYFEKGDIAKAVETADNAIAHSSGEDKAKFTANRDKYKSQLK